MNGRNLVSAIPLLGILALCTARLMMADDSNPTRPPVSSYAPAEDLVNQVDFYMGRIEETLAKKEDFDDAAKARLKKDANTLAALFFVLGDHDKDNRFKSSGRTLGLMLIALEIPELPNFDAASTKFAELKKEASPNDTVARSGGSMAGRKPSLEQLMKQVAIVNSTLKRGVTPARFQTQQTQSAGQSATLAAISQTIWSDAHVAKNPAEVEKWHQFSAEMRDAAGAVNAAIHDGDQPAATTGMTRLAKSCETCHAEFRKDKN